MTSMISLPGVTWHRRIKTVNPDWGGDACPDRSSSHANHHPRSAGSNGVASTLL